VGGPLEADVIHKRQYPRRPAGPKPVTKPRLDELDRRLLAELQDDARVSSAELARRFDLSGPGLQKRLHRLEQQGVIRGYATLVSREAVGLDLLCFVHVMLAHHRPNSVKRFPDRIRRLPEVLECHYLTGEVDYLLKVVVTNHDHLERFLFEKLMKVQGVDRVRTSIVLKEIKASTALPL
jgi:Lrp/AsnC family transcriptional regulator, leucine-responsive regulatory protein